MVRNSMFFGRPSASNLLCNIICCIYSLKQKIAAIAMDIFWIFFQQKSCLLCCLRINLWWRKLFSFVFLSAFRSSNKLFLWMKKSLYSVHFCNYDIFTEKFQILFDCIMWAYQALSRKACCHMCKYLVWSRYVPILMLLLYRELSLIIKLKLQ